MAEIIVIHGTPGAGKTSLSKRLVSEKLENRRVIHLSSGDKIRGIRTGTQVSRFSPEQINDPGMNEVEKHRIVNEIMFEEIDGKGENALVLLDGYPRYEGAVDHFLEAVNRGGHKLIGCINMNISLDTCLTRLSERGSRRGERIIVTPENITGRFEEYNEKVEKTVDRFREVTRVVDMTTEEPIEKVWEEFRGEVIGLVCTKQES